jgi:hypothetical protein
MSIWKRLRDRIGAALDRRLVRQWEALEKELEERLAEDRQAREVLIDAALAGQRLRAREQAAEKRWSHPTARPIDDVMDAIARIERERGRQ